MYKGNYPPTCANTTLRRVQDEKNLPAQEAPSQEGTRLHEENGYR